MSADRIAEYIVKYRYGYLVKNVNLTEGKNEFECSRGDAQQTITIDVERTGKDSLLRSFMIFLQFFRKNGSLQFLY